jgi:hypothetical protein
VPGGLLVTLGLITADDLGDLADQAAEQHRLGSGESRCGATAADGAESGPWQLRALPPLGFAHVS